MWYISATKRLIILLACFGLLSLSLFPAQETTVKGDSDPAKLYKLMAKLLAFNDTPTNDATQISELHKFVSLYSKFQNRPTLMTEEVLFTLYKHYRDYNVLVDYVEKLPLKQPATVIKLLEKAKFDDWKNSRDKILFTAMYQSMLELFSHTAKYGPGKHDYETLVLRLTDIPYDRDVFYDEMFKYFREDLKVDYRKQTLMDFVLEGIGNPGVTIDGIDYKFMAKDNFKRSIRDIVKSQESCLLTDLLKINRYMDQLTRFRDDYTRATRIVNDLVNALRGLPFAEISSEAPNKLRSRVMFYSRKSFEKDLENLVEKVSQGAPAAEVNKIIDKIKRKYLTVHLKDHLLTLAYAVNARNPKLKVFLNPNMVRLHDFYGDNSRTPWNYSSTPPLSDEFAHYYLSGGLSRLNLSFAAKWHDHIFGRSAIYDSAHTQALLANILELYPAPDADRLIEYNSLLVDLGLELMEKAPKDENLKKQVIEYLGDITAGYNYSKTMDYLEGKFSSHQLFFTELKKLGEQFFLDKTIPTQWPVKKQLEPFYQNPAQHPRFGRIHFRTFGRLTPGSPAVFPQDTANHFDSGWVSGEMVEEFVIKIGWHMHKKKIPSRLLGHVLYNYYTKIVPRAFSQNHFNDYYPTYFALRIFNNAHLSKIVKDLQKNGYLRLK